MVHLSTNNFFALLALLALLALFSAAHPGHDGLKEEIAERMAYLKNSPRNLDHCAAKLEARGVQARTFARRMSAVEGLQDDVKMKKSMAVPLSVIFSALTGDRITRCSPDIL